MLKLVWKRDPDLIGHKGFAGKYHLFTIKWDDWAKDRWTLTSTLPGLNGETWYREGRSEMKLMTTAMTELENWIEAIGVEAKII